MPAALRCPLSGKLMEDPVVLRGDGVLLIEAIEAFLASHPLSAWDAVAGWTRQLLDASLGPAAAPPPSRSHSPSSSTAATAFAASAAVAEPAQGDRDERGAHADAE